MAFSRSGLVLGALTLAVSVFLHADNMTAAGQPEERTISFYHIHTQERLTVTYKRNGQYIPEALKQINWIMRDWRKNEVKEIAPATIDIAWEMHEELGSKEPINIICGYRSAGTNEMLRRTVGGQAKQSQHITGKAIDITFPDIPLKKMRYSALIRERGGVGYYPTSGVPFVHVDTANVRMWPRMPRQELALLFPNGRSKYVPDDGRPITPADVTTAQSKFRELATQVAEFFHDRRTPGTSRTMVASVEVSPPKKSLNVVATLGNVTQPAVASAEGSLRRNVSLTTEPDPALTAPRPFAPAQVASLEPDVQPTPQLKSAPKLVDRSSRFTLPSQADRGKLDALVTAAATTPMPELVQGPRPAVRPQKALAAVALAETKQSPDAALTARVASLDPAAGTDMHPASLGNGWAQSPQFDEDHPDELDYRPFPLAPLLSDKPASRDQPLAEMQAPDVAATLEVLDDVGGIVPMKFRTGRQLAESASSDQFSGKAVHAEALMEIERSRMPAGIENRAVQTSAR
ncbi:MAG: DUF882 domain-containing protein [Proteobacteria bacterium]|nr:DUF882 domain-containing protein [Pseudomonadota bacterium]